MIKVSLEVEKKTVIGLAYVILCVNIIADLLLNLAWGLTVTRYVEASLAIITIQEKLFWLPWFYFIPGEYLSIQWLGIWINIL